jgi:hypothetical protein
MLKLWMRFRDYVTIGLAALLLVTSFGWYTTNLKYKAEKNGREADHQTYIAEQAKFKAKALENKMEVERIANEKAKQADTDYSTLFNKYNSILVRYKAAQGAVSRPSVPLPSGSSGSGNGPGTSADVPSDTITILYSDAEICADNTARLEAVQTWALDLKKQNSAQAGKVN